MNLGFKYLFIFACSLGGILSTHAQIKWVNPLNESQPMVWNQAFQSETAKTFHRLPERAKKELRPVVWRLSQHSAGLSLRFKSTAKKIYVRYTVGEPLSKPHMPATGVSGLDLYAYRDGKETYCYGNYSFRDTISYQYVVDRLPMHTSDAEYHLYLPLYNRVKWLEIGVEEKENLEMIPARHEQKPILIYGTSIVQGACASRPAMAWANILHRHLRLPVINLGFSGNGRLEPEVLNFVNEIDAQIYILDCMPNLTRLSEEKIEALVINAVHQIREKHPHTPILLVEHAGYSNMFTCDEQYERCERANRAQKSAYRKIQRQKVKNIYYLSHQQLSWSMDGWVDSVHPSEVSMQRQAEVVEAKIRKILRIKKDSFVHN